MIGFLAWQTALGIFIAGLIIGWFLSIGVAYRIARRDDQGLWNKILNQGKNDNDR